MNFSEQCFRIFEQATEAYHVTDNVDATVHNPYAVKSIEFYLYLKNWIDAVQYRQSRAFRIDRSVRQYFHVLVFIQKETIDQLYQIRTILIRLLEQKKDLSMALDQLLSDIRDGKKYMKVYKQMKMYNDPALNPVLYGKK